MKKEFQKLSFILCFTLGFTFLIVTIALPEQLTLTTYYPSPYGVYAELRAQQMAIGDAYYDQATYPTIDANADLIVEGRVGIGMVAPTEMLEISGGKLKVASTIIDDGDISRSDSGILSLGSATTVAVASVPPFSAPIMLDSDNGSFLVNPAGTSVFDTIDLNGESRNNWSIKQWKLVSCTGVGAGGHCTPACGAGWSLISNMAISSYAYWTHVGLCKEN